MAILVGIDGTGSEATPGEGRNTRYDAAFVNSFVSRICQQGGPRPLYRRGPVLLGGGMVNAVADGTRFVRDRHRLNSSERVLLTGYSRGAAGVVAIATNLKELNIPVRAIMLFDCVDRHVAIDAETIPNNVGFVHHVMRDPLSSSRESFGNDGTQFSAPTVYTSKKYMCTHGGMGGVPWTPEPGQSPTDFINEGMGVTYDGATTISFRQDGFVSMQIWSEIQPFLATHGFMSHRA